RLARANPLVKLDGLGIVGAAVVQKRQVEASALVVGVFIQGPLVKLDRPLMVPVPFRVESATEKLFGSTLVDRRSAQVVHGTVNPAMVTCCYQVGQPLQGAITQSDKR